MRPFRTEIDTIGPIDVAELQASFTHEEPLLVVDVEHLGRTANALLRQPTVVRLRPDLSYHDVVDGEGA